MMRKKLPQRWRERLSAHLENLRLTEQTQQALTNTETLYAGSARVVQASTISEVLEALVNSTALNRMENVVILLFDRPWHENPTTLSLVANWTKPDVPAVLPAGTTLSIAQMPILSMWNPEQPIILQDVKNDPGLEVDVRQVLINLDIHSMLGLALTTGDSWFGVIVGNSSVPLSGLRDEDVRQMRSLADQATTVIRNLQLLAETGERARREQLLREITAHIYAAPDAEMILRTAAKEVNRALNLETFVYLEDMTDVEEPSSNGH
ncbi:MAG: hypothetical protein R3E31_15320 [Chloroflexota bacterium]